MASIELERKQSSICKGFQIDRKVSVEYPKLKTDGKKLPDVTIDDPSRENTEMSQRNEAEKKQEEKEGE